MKLDDVCELFERQEFPQAHVRDHPDRDAVLNARSAVTAAVRDDEFLVPRTLTEGRSAIQLRIRFTPVKRPLFPGQPLPELAWSEIRYTAYCFVMPEVP